MRFPYMPPSTDSLLLCTFAVRSRSSALLFILECVAKLAFYLEFTKYFLNYFRPADNKAEEKAQKRHNDRQKPIISIFYNLFFCFFLFSLILDLFCSSTDLDNLSFDFSILRKPKFGILFIIFAASFVPDFFEVPELSASGIHKNGFSFSLKESVGKYHIIVVVSVSFCLFMLIAESFITSLFCSKEVEFLVLWQPSNKNKKANGSNCWIYLFI